MKTPKSNKKRSKQQQLSIFDAVQDLNVEDQRAEIKRRKRSTTVDNRRAVAAQDQSKIYDKLLECRILLQQALSSTTTTTTKEEEEEDEEESSTISKNKRTEQDSLFFQDQCNALLIQLLQARNELLPNSKKGIDYETIVTQSEECSSESPSSLEQVLQTEYNHCQKEWKDVLNRRHKDIRLHSGVTTSNKSQFKILDSTFWQQVESTVEYEQLTSNRTVARSNSITGGTDIPDFDDSKVYQQLLKDYIATSSSSTTGGTTAGEAASKRLLAKANKKAGKSGGDGLPKKQVDRRASKGRKLRYTEIPKLVNFTFPLSRPNTNISASSTSLNQDEWFQSLFGGAATTRGGGGRGKTKSNNK